jgi:membrane fusion protein (multidrug efflux system)
LLVRLDDRDVRAAADAEAILQQRKATRMSLHARYALQQSAIQQASADLDAKIAGAEFAKLDAKRYRSLAVSKTGSRQDAQRTSALEQQARAAVASAQAGLAAAKEQLTVLDAEIAEVDAAVTQAEADLQTARLNLGYAEIRSPIDGYIGNRAAQAGSYVSQGAQVMIHVSSVVPGVNFDKFAVDSVNSYIYVQKNTVELYAPVYKLDKNTFALVAGPLGYDGSAASISFQQLACL